MPDNTFLLKQLTKPAGRIDVVLDTDTFNEIDDQFALAYMVRSTEKLDVQAVYAAPFHNEKSTDPADGMEKSYAEILNVLTLCGREDLHAVAFKGSERYLPDERTPVQSPAASDLIRRAMEHTPEKPLYVVAIGAITNVASALLIEPAIAERIIIVWLGGNAHFLPNHPEFNMVQDIAAGRVVFGSGAPLVQLPCAGVVTHLTTTEPELRHHLKGKSPLGDYLYRITCGEVAGYVKDEDFCWSRVIWDVSAVAWLLDHGLVGDAVIHAPIPSYDNGYVFSDDRHFMKVATHINRDAIFTDLFRKINQR